MTQDQAELITKRIVVVGHMLDELTLAVGSLPEEDETIKREFRMGIGKAMTGILEALIPVRTHFPDLDPYPLDKTSL